jgi:AcrR family transcriptional regulator
LDAGHLCRRDGCVVTVAPRPTRRSYNSSRRKEQAAQNREGILAAATALFSEKGWAATGMRDVAAAAGVAVETVYSNFSTKPELLLRAIDVGVVGDAEAVPLSRRPEFAALGVGAFSERIAAAARLLTDINRRSWGLRRALTEAAASDPQLDRALHGLETRRRDNIREGVEMVLGHATDEETLDMCWVVMGSETYCLLTKVGGRTEQDYQQWLAATATRVLDPEGRHR